MTQYGSRPGLVRLIRMRWRLGGLIGSRGPVCGAAAVEEDGAGGAFDHGTFMGHGGGLARGTVAQTDVHSPADRDGTRSPPTGQRPRIAAHLMLRAQCAPADQAGTVPCGKPVPGSRFYARADGNRPWLRNGEYLHRGKSILSRQSLDIDAGSTNLEYTVLRALNRRRRFEA